MNIAAMRVSNIFTDGQAQARATAGAIARAFGAEEALKNLGLMFPIHARRAVIKLDAPVGCLIVQRHFNPAPLSV